MAYFRDGAFRGVGRCAAGTLSLTTLFDTFTRRSMTDDPFELPHGAEFEPDTPTAAGRRVRDRFRAIHPQVTEIVTGHAALELEVDRVLRRFLPRPNKLPRLSIEHQLGVLRALLDDAWLDLVLDAISAYGALRNSVAHGDSPSDIEKIISRLANKMHNIGPPLTPNTNLGTLALGLAVALHVLGIWGDYAVIAPMETFMETNGTRHPTELAHLYGARLAVAHETEAGRCWAEAKIKSLTGGDKITARYMRGDFFDFTPKFKLMIVGNHKPSLPSVDEAIRRRFHLVPFTVTIPAKSET